MMQLDLNLRRSSRERGHAAAKLCADKADRVRAQWTRTALQAVRCFLMTIGTNSFLTEDVRDYASAQGVDDPHDGRAWGHVMQRAKREGIAVPIGYAAAKSSNGSPKVLWRRA